MPIELVKVNLRIGINNQEIFHFGFPVFFEIALSQVLIISSIVINF